MEEKLRKAREVLVRIYEIDELDIVFMNSRDGKKVSARKLYNYYLWKHLKVKHNQMKKYIQGMHHATSIYQKNKLEFELQYYTEIQDEWNTFLYFTDHNEWRKEKEGILRRAKYLI
jgi:hypothetical protein